MEREGLENAPQAFIGLFKGENFGRTLGYSCIIKDFFIVSVRLMQGTLSNIGILGLVRE